MTVWNIERGKSKMAKIKNKLRQPLIVNIDDKTSVHFLSKEVKEVKDEVLNDGEFKNHIEQGNLVVIQLG